MAVLGSLRSLPANRLESIAVAVSVATGAVASEVEYDSFGQRSIVAGIEADLVRYGYTGREHDAETGLLYDRARHDDPATGTFLQQDPIDFAAGDLNLYAYVENDSFNWTDPSGLSAVPAPLAAMICANRAVCRVAPGVLGLATGISAMLQSISFDDWNLNEQDGGSAGRGGDGRPLDRNDNGGPPSR